MRGTQVAEAVIGVTGDMKPFRRALQQGRAIARTQGDSAGSTFRTRFGSHLKHIGRDLRNIVRDNPFRRVTRYAQNAGSAMSSAIGGAARVVKNAWSNIDNEVRLVLGLIAVSAGQLAAILSAVGSTAVSVGSSIGMALGSIIPLIGVGTTGAIAIGLMVSAMDEMRARFPAINQGIDRIKNAWSGWVSNFAAEAGPGLGRVLNSLAQQMERFDFGTPMGRAMGGISDAFARALQSPGVKAFFQSLTEEYPRALEAFGAGAANVFSALSSLLAGAAPAAERLGEMFRKWSARLAEAAEQARTSGAMREVFERVGDSVSAVMNVIGSLGRAIGAVFMATSAHGNDLLNGFAGLIDRFTDWVKSAEGQQRINEWLETGKALLPAMGNLVKGVGQALANLVTPTTIGLARDFMNTLGEWIPKFSDVLKAVAKLDILGNMVDFLNMISDATAPLLPHLTNLAQIIGESVSGAIQNASPLFQALASAAEPLIERFVEIAGDIAPKIVEAIGRISTAVGPVIEVFGIVANVIQSVLLPVLSWLVEGAIQGVVDAFEGLGTMFQGVIDLVSSLIEGDWRGAFSALGDIVMGAIQAVWGIFQVWFFGRIFTLVRTVLSGILRFFGSIWGSIANVTRSVFSGISNFLSMIWNGIVTVITAVWNGIVSFLSSTWSGILAVVTTVGTAIWGFIQGTWETISEITTSVWNTIVEAIQIAWEWILATIQVVVNSISEFLTGAWEMISTTVTTVWTTIGEFISTIWTTIQTAIQTAVTFIQTIISTVWTTIQTVTSTVWTAISSFFTSVWTGIQNAIQAAIQFIQNIITTVWSAISAYISTVMNVIRTVFTTVWNAIKSFISSAINGIRSTISSVWNAIKSFISTTMNSIRNTFRTIWNAIKSVIQSNINNIRSVIRSVWNGIKSFISSVMNGIRSTFSSIWNSIRSTISSVINGIRSTISSVWNSIRSTISSVMNGIRSVISSVWNSIRSVVSSVVNGVRSVVSTGFNGARNAAVNAFNSMRNAVSNTISGLLNRVRTAANNIMSAFRNIIGNMRTIGRNIITGLINGVGSMGNALWNAARRVARGAMDAIKGLFGINSPSREMRKVGVWIGEGFNLGLGDEEKEVAKGMERLGEAAMGGMDVRKYMNAGTDAAEAFANGLNSVDPGILEPTIGDVSRRAGMGHLGTGRPSREEIVGGSSSGTVVENGAIQVNTPAQDGRIVAGQMLDELVKVL